VTQANEGDIFILASDGRDDLIVPGPDGPTLNEDPDLFLHTVEDNAGDAETIFKTLCAGDRLTDDLSIISVTFPAAASHNLSQQDARDASVRESEHSPH
ncbi:MAG TPA: hypothetical protein PKC35_16565, partial [Leptospiraceae bacterium]|nr:hypothetical protein [Leptospiraceae bacterium]